MKQIIKLYLEQIENTVIMRVLQQENIKKHLSEHICVSNIIGFGDDRIWIRGTERIRDHITDCEVFDTIEEATEYLQRIISWLDEVFARPLEAPKRGDYVMVKDNRHKYYVPRIFLYEMYGSMSPYITVDKDYEEEFKKGEPFKYNDYDQMQPIIKSSYDFGIHIYYGEREFE